MRKKRGGKFVAGSMERSNWEKSFRKEVMESIQKPGNEKLKKGGV